MFTAVVVIVLAAFAVGTLFAGRWEELSRSLRLALLLGGLAVSHGGAWLALKRPTAYAELGHALVLAGVGLFGPALLFTAQMFSVVGRLPDALALWAMVALVAAAVVPSRPPLWLALFLFLAWSFLETAAFERPLHALFLLPWTVCLGVALWRRWRIEASVAFGVLVVWYGVAGLGLAVNSAWPASAVAALFVLPPVTAWAIGGIMQARGMRVGGALGHAAFLGFVGSLVALGLSNPVGMAPPPGWTVPAAAFGGVAAGALVLRAIVLGPSLDVLLVALTAGLAFARPWIPSLEPAPAMWLIPVGTLLLTLAFMMWGMLNGHRFLTGVAAMASGVQAVVWMVTAL